MWPGCILAHGTEYLMAVTAAGVVLYFAQKALGAFLSLLRTGFALNVNECSCLDGTLGVTGCFLFCSVLGCKQQKCLKIGFEFVLSLVG